MRAYICYKSYIQLVFVDMTLLMSLRQASPRPRAPACSSRSGIVTTLRGAVKVRLGD